MRSDAIGIFWQDVPRKGGQVVRPMPAIPDTGWTTPTEFPNLRAAKAIAIDTETYDPELKQKGPGWARGKGHLVGIAVGLEDGQSWYFPMRHEVEKNYNMDPEHVLAWAKDQLTDPRQAKIGANIIYDVGWLRQEGVHVQGPLFDVQYAEALLTEALTVNLDDLAQRYLKIPKVGAILYEWCAAYYGGSETMKQRENIYRAPPRLVGPYAQGDVELPFRIIKQQWDLLEKEKLLHLFDLENRLIYLMVEMRFAGVSIDVGHTERMRDYLQDHIEQVDKEMESLVGFPVDTNSNANLANAFDTVGLPYPRTAKGAPSFTKGYLSTLNHRLPELIVTRREHEKLRGTFLESYILNSHINGKVYGQFHPLRTDDGGTRSGRFSSSTPNLQNIPSRTQLGKEIRKSFTPDAAHRRWVKMDFCLAPETDILTADLRWKKLNDICVGDVLIGYDEISDPRRYLHATKVLKVTHLHQPCYRITTDRTQIVASAQHRWLSQANHRQYAVPQIWQETQDLKKGQRIIRSVEKWEEEEKTFDLGWLAGFFDGEGYISNSVIGVGQKPGACLEYVQRLLTKYGFEYKTHTNRRNDVVMLRLIGGRNETWRFLGTVRPLRLMEQALNKIIEGRTVTAWTSADTILSVEYIGTQKVIGIETEHKTFLAEGLCSHNSQIEYRGLAHFATGPGSDNVRTAYNENPDTDFHVAVQTLIRETVGLSLERPLVKNINFGTAYGMGKKKLAAYLDLKSQEAEKLFGAIHQAAPFLTKTMEDTSTEADALGYITTILNRRSRFGLWVPERYSASVKPLPYDRAILSYRNIRRAGIHKALNRRLQGSAADLLKVAMLQCWDDGVFDVTGVPRLTVHDELDFSDPGGVDEAFAEVQRIMETAIKFNVPIRVKCEIGPNWGDLEQVE